MGGCGQETTSLPPGVPCWAFSAVGVLFSWFEFFAGGGELEDHKEVMSAEDSFGRIGFLQVLRAGEYTKTNKNTNTSQIC